MVKLVVRIVLYGGNTANNFIAIQRQKAISRQLEKLTADYV